MNDLATSFALAMALALVSVNPGTTYDSAADQFSTGRDWINAVKPGYAKYAYPHPLRDDGLPALPEGFGLAAAYPGDGGIAAAPAVLFAEDFEGYVGDRISWSELGGWDNVYGDLVITRNAVDVHAGNQALQVTHLQPGAHGAVKQVPGQDVLFIRYYQKFSAAFPGCHHTGCYIRGGAADALWDNPTGVKPDGTNHFVASFDHLSPLHGWDPPANDTPPGWSYNYCYHMDQGSNYGDVLLPSGPLDGSDLLGDDFVPRPDVAPPRDRWLCCEIMLRCNTPGQRDGRVALWIDGILVADHPNLRFRTVADLQARFATLSTYSSQVQADKVLWYDDLVVATSYIGPMAAVPADRAIAMDLLPGCEWDCIAPADAAVDAPAAGRQVVRVAAGQDAVIVPLVVPVGDG